MIKKSYRKHNYLLRLLLQPALSRLLVSRQVWVLAVTVFIIALIARLAVLSSTGASMSDDALITLRVARNLATGQGFEYNPGYRLQSSSSPLWALMAAGLWWFVGDWTLTIMPILGGLADALTAFWIVLLVAGPISLHGRELQHNNPPLERVPRLIGAALAGLFYAGLSTNTLVTTIGLETGFYTMIISMTLWSMAIEHYSLAAGLAGLAMLLRPDGALLGLFVLFTIVLRNRQLPLKEFVILVLVVAPYSLFALFYYGTLIPQSMVAKGMVVQSAAEQWIFFINKFFLGNPVAWLLGVSYVIGLTNILFKWRDLVLPLFWGLAYIASFSTFASWWPWYLPPAMIGYSLAVGLGLGAIVTSLNLSLPWKIRVSVLAAVVMLVALLIRTRDHIIPAYERTPLYAQRLELATWIDQHTSQDATVMLEPVGMVGFFSSRHFHDYPGLVSSKVTDALVELGQPIPGKPIDPVVISHLLGRVQPTILILRQDEYQANLLGESLGDYELAHVLPVESTVTERYHSVQTMFVLVRKGDPSFLGNLEDHRR